MCACMSTNVPPRQAPPPPPPPAPQQIERIEHTFIYLSTFRLCFAHLFMFSRLVTLSPFIQKKRQIGGERESEGECV